MIIYECDTCLDDSGLPLQMLGQIPSHENILRGLEKNGPEWVYECSCGRNVVLNALTFERVRVIPP